MLRFVDTVIVPYFDQVHEKLPLCKCTQPSLCIFDVFTAHLSEELKEKLKEHKVHRVFVHIE